MRIDLAGWSRDATLGGHREFLAFFEAAERMGFDGVWFHEFRLQAEPWPYPCPLLLAAALLARTERLRVGTSVLVSALHEPALLAEQIAQLQFQGQGRFDAGIGRGTDPQTLTAMGISADQTRERFEQTMALLQAQASSSAPEHARAPHLFVAASSQSSIDEAVRVRVPLLLSLEPPEATQLERLALSPAQSPQQLQWMRQHSSLSRYVCIGQTAQEVQEQLESLWPLLWHRRLYFAGKRGVAPHEVPPLDRTSMLREQFIHGTPDQCWEQIQQTVAQTGSRHWRLVFNANGLWSRETAAQGMRLFSQTLLSPLQRL
ncbi:LLM class flavin-dependent oxidoreductase [Lampropedia puyangensis]|uniref:LLM class flavin-dependent oxidoreductase n=1 Tax=Lampropedia puyangensis TaxID=1330072 RepID=A0A4S8F654_9BURK|nr:LLM class flavin-dependent oxidoreductase [Lampropedia puyangensis]THU02567.1 LLM class flavin-dependent oxidoreductase [Lampropedia puyangensis]